MLRPRGYLPATGNLAELQTAVARIAFRNQFANCFFDRGEINLEHVGDRLAAERFVGDEDQSFGDRLEFGVADFAGAFDFRSIRGFSYFVFA